jgi:hypothetical protein
MRIKGSHLEKLEALAATGMPGAYKVFIFYLVQELYGLPLLGDIASWQSVAQIFGFFTAIGWCSLIMVRVAKAQKKQERVAIFNRLMLMGLMTLGCFCTLILMTGVIVDKNIQSFQIALWLCAWTVYQLPRHHLIAQKKYRQALILDMAIIISSSIFLLRAKEDFISMSLAGCMLGCGTLAMLAIQRRKGSQKMQLGYDTKGLEYGMINLLSGGIALCIVPIAANLAGNELAGAISLFIAISGVALLLPRALSLNRLPEIAQSASNPQKLQSMTTCMQRQISLSNLVTTLFCIIAAILVTWHFRLQLNSTQTVAILFLITLQGTAGTQSLVYANLLMAKEISGKVLKVNLISFIAFVISCAAVFSTTPPNPLIYIHSAILALSIYRLISIKNISKENPIHA